MVLDLTDHSARHFLPASIKYGDNLLKRESQADYRFLSLAPRSKAQPETDMRIAEGCADIYGREIGVGDDSGGGVCMGVHQEG